MIQFLASQTSQKVIEKAAHIAEVDPHGWTLTLVSVCVVFGVLLLLSIIYTYIGKYFARHSNGVKALSSEEAAAVAIAVDRYFEDENSGEVQAAIAMALHRYAEENLSHDFESGVITIKR